MRSLSVLLTSLTGHPRPPAAESDKHHGKITHIYSEISLIHHASLHQTVFSVALRVSLDIQKESTFTAEEDVCGVEVRDCFELL